MARQKFKLSLRVYMNRNRTIVRNCTAVLYSVHGIPVLNMDLYLDSDTFMILTNVCKKFRNLAMNDVYFIDVDVHSLIMCYNYDGLFSPNYYVGNLIASASSGSSLALLIRILRKSECVV